MSEPCARCGAGVPEWDVPVSRVTEEEAREFARDRLRVGDVVCAACFHELKWPREQTPESLGLDWWT